MKLYKKISYLVVLLVTMFIISGVKANSIDKIDMDVYIDTNGTAHIKEVWEVYLKEGTEGYKPYSDLGISKVTNFKVVDDTEREYEELSTWNTKASFNEKAYKSGINYTKDGLELCFGISKYGNRTYTLTYDITDFVTQYTDTQGIYFTFIDMDQYVGKAKVTIYSDTPFSIEDNVKIWGYGHHGTTTIEDGKIVIETDQAMYSWNYLSGLVRFETNMFSTKKTSTKSFDDIYGEAMEGVDDPDGKKDSEHSVWYYIFVVPFMIIVILLAMVCNPGGLFFLFIILYLIMGKNWFADLSEKMVFDGGKKLGDVPAFRDIPCNKDLFYAYFLTHHYDITPSKNIKEGIIGAILLKWLDKNEIDIVDGKKKLFSFKDNNYVVDFNRMSAPTDELEKEIYDMFIAAAGTNRLLESKEFEKWCTKNYYKMNKWFDKILTKEASVLENKGLIVKDSEEVKMRFGKNKERPIKRVKSEVKDEATKLAGLKKFLLEYSSMKEKKFIEVHLWNEYLMFAELLGIADKVKEQFSKLYPEFKTNESYNLDRIDILTTVASSAYKGYTVGLNRASARSYSGGGSYSGHSSYSGGGGHSFSSGGHSSSGSHGGGFR